jgi:hypothetical protein
MKMLEYAWVLKHRPLVESLHEGREHLEKIFQLKLSLPSKAFIPLKEFEPEYSKIGGEQNPAYEDENKLIKSYLESLAPEIPPELKNFIAGAFPPNPRKIKRAMSLAYFIGKNLNDMNDVEFMITFPFVLFWSVASTYFPDLAGLGRIAPKFLVDVMSLVRGTSSVRDLIHMLDHAGKPLDSIFQNPSDDCKCAWEILIQNPRLEKFANDSIVSNRFMYRFLRAAFDFFDSIPVYKMIGPETYKAREAYEKINRKQIYEDNMRRVIEKAGLIS